ncbi:hypothetical protein CD798_15920 [Bacillaceae bacterium SAOS 7]|nr:hypothetical protein CD798_15920 [Bacillaceae bacterium SAOS 7]
MKYILTASNDISAITAGKKETDTEVTNLGTVVNAGTGLNAYANNGKYVVAIEVDANGYVVAKGVSAAIDEAPSSVDSLTVGLTSAQADVTVAATKGGTVKYILATSNDISAVTAGKKETDTEVTNLGTVENTGTGLNVVANNGKYVVAIEVDADGYVVAKGVSAAINE